MAEREYVGTIHIHTRFSDGRTPAAEVIAIARAVGLDYLVISDHNSDAARPAGLTGWHGRTLCVSGPEVGRRHCPHFIALGLRDPASLLGLSPTEALAEAGRRGAATFIAHPHVARLRWMWGKPVDWSDWDAPLGSGLEIWSYMHDVLHQSIPWRLPRLALNHRRLVRGPRPETLAVWDRLGGSRRVAGIGALDNHAAMIFGMIEVFPHADLFRLLRTHVVCEALPEDGAAAEAALAKALGEGRCFVALDGWADSAGFRLRAEGPGGTLGLGQEAPYAPGWRLAVESPQAADLRLLRDGVPLATLKDARSLEAAVDGPGVYRVEARLGGRPWVYTNPIYFRG